MRTKSHGVRKMAKKLGVKVINIKLSKCKASDIAGIPVPRGKAVIDYAKNFRIKVTDIPLQYDFVIERGWRLDDKADFDKWMDWAEKGGEEQRPLWFWA